MILLTLVDLEQLQSYGRRAFSKVCHFIIIKMSLNLFRALFSVNFVVVLDPPVNLTCT